MVDIFTSSKHPQAATDLISALQRRDKSVSKTTVYRELESLTESGVITSVNLLDGQLRYELQSGSGTHSHIVCTNCERIECLPIASDIAALTRRVAKAVDFEVTGHVLEFFGRCNSCR